MTRHPTSGEPSVVFAAFSRAYGFTLPAKGSEIFGVCGEVATGLTQPTKTRIKR